jgi:hypothetical protein
MLFVRFGDFRFYILFIVFSNFTGAKFIGVALETESKRMSHQPAVATAPPQKD